MNLQNSGECCREKANAYLPVMPAQAGIQYSETPAMEARTRGVLDTRRSLSSGAHSRDPVGRVDTPPHSRDSIRPSFAKFRSSQKQEGRREDRVRAAPAVSCANAYAKKNAHEHTGSAETLRPSLRNGFTAYIVLSPARPGLFVTVASVIDRKSVV